MIWFLVGLWVGALLGMMIMAIFIAAGRADERSGLK
jgi:hypothetical protein